MGKKKKDPDSEVVVFAKRTVRDLKLPPQFITQIAQSIQVFPVFIFITFQIQPYFCFLLIFLSFFNLPRFNFVRLSLLSLDHTKDKTCTLLRKLSPSRSAFFSLSFHVIFNLYICAMWLCFVSSSQLDLRVNHTLIKDHFLWVRFGNCCCISLYDCKLFVSCFCFRSGPHAFCCYAFYLCLLHFRTWTIMKVILKNLLEPSATIWALKTQKLG